VKDIALINNPSLTGITMIDALAPMDVDRAMLMIEVTIWMRGFTVDFLKDAGAIWQQYQDGVYAAKTIKKRRRETA
jgi:hypothetical protein